MKAEVWFDGACSGNPGPMGAGAVVVIDGKKTAHHKAGGHGTNNEAEYDGLILGLEAALERGATHVIVRGDSQLVIRQLEGRYAVKARHLRPRYDRARALLDAFQSWQLEWVARDSNAEADAAARRPLE